MKQEEQTEEKRQIELAPEREKLIIYKNKLIEVATTEEPTGLSDKGQDIVQQSKSMINTISKYIVKEIDYL